MLAVEIAVDLAVEIAVEIAMASVLGLHGVPLLATAFRGSPWNVRGSPWSVRGSPRNVRSCPWNAVEIAVECRGGPWALPRCYAKKTNNLHTSWHRGGRFALLRPRGDESIPQRFEGPHGNCRVEIGRRYS